MLLSRLYLEGNRLTIRINHDPLKWNLNLSKCTDYIARRRHRLSEFDFDGIHRAGVKNQAADALFRLATTETDTSPLEGDRSPLIMDASATGTISETNVFDTYKLGNIYHDTIMIANPTPTAHDDNSMPPSIQKVLKKRNLRPILPGHIFPAMETHTQGSASTNTNFTFAVLSRMNSSKL